MYYYVFLSIPLTYPRFTQEPLVNEKGFAVGVDLEISDKKGKPKLQKWSDIVDRSAEYMRFIARKRKGDEYSKAFLMFPVRSDLQHSY